MNTVQSSVWQQSEITLQPRPRGFHLVTAEVVAALPGLSRIQMGLMHCLLQHTSASLFLTENADPTVRGDLESHFNVLAPENAPHYRHTLEGPDDMPAHVKSVLLGTGLVLPVRDGRLALGTWQGICLGEHRENGGSRRIVVTLNGMAA